MAVYIINCKGLDNINKGKGKTDTYEVKDVLTY